MFGTEDVLEDGRQGTGIVMGEVLARLQGHTNANCVLDRRSLKEVFSPRKDNTAGPLR